VRLNGDRVCDEVLKMDMMGMFIMRRKKRHLLSLYHVSPYTCMTCHLAFEVLQMPPSHSEYSLVKQGVSIQNDSTS